MRKLSVILFLFLFFSSISIVSASEYNLDINAELVDYKLNNLNLDENIPLEQNLAIRFTIVNNNNLWINVNNFGVSMKANKDGERFFPISSVIDTLIVDKLLIPPQNKAEFYVVLEEYNSLPKNDRIGSWGINFESTKLSSNAFEASDLTKNGYLPLDLIKPNNIEFIVIKEKALLDENVNFITKSISFLSNHNLATTSNIINILVGIAILWGIVSGKLKNVYTELSKIVEKKTRKLPDFEKTEKYKDFIEEEEVQDLLAHFKNEGIEISLSKMYGTFEESKDDYDKFKEIIGISTEIEDRFKRPSRSIHSDYISIYRKYFNPRLSCYT